MWKKTSNDDRARQATTFYGLLCHIAYEERISLRRVVSRGSYKINPLNDFIRIA
jgi:hypothetical protein